MRESHKCKRTRLGDFWGAGCHFDRDVALIRALTEAAQSRLTYIVGARDDLDHELYAEPRVPLLFEDLLDFWEQGVTRRRYSDVPSCAADSFEADLETLLSRLRAAGLPQAIVIDLTDEKIGIPVVKTVVPGLEAHDEHDRLQRGIRARAFLRTQQ